MKAYNHDNVLLKTQFALLIDSIPTFAKKYDYY